MIFVIKAVNILYQYASLYPCSLLCFFLFSDQIKYPLRKLARIFALITLPFAAMPVVLAVFDIENTSFVFSIAYMLVGFICLRKLTRNYAPQKLLFVMCMVAHVAVMAGEMEQAFSTLIRVPFYYAQTHLGFAAVFILLRLGLYLIIWIVMSRVLLPNLRELESKEMSGLWALPAFFMVVSIYRTATYYNSNTVDTLDMMFPLIFLLLAVMSFTMYGLILRMLASAAKNAALERMNRLKTDLMTTISHEARTPLAVLSTYAWLVSKELQQKDVGEQVSADLDVIISQAKQVADLIDSLKEVTMGTIDPEKQTAFDISELLRQTAALYRPILVRAGTDLIIEIEDGLQVYGRAEELTHVIFNLLQNAKDYTEQGAVSIGAKKENGNIIITVADTGTGVDPSILSIIFQRGVKGGKSSGMGIGLSICREIIDRHNGEILIENIEAGGALITLTLPSYEGGTKDEL